MRYYDEDKEKFFRVIWDCVMDLSRLAVIIAMAICLIKIAVKVTTLL